MRFAPVDWLLFMLVPLLGWAIVVFFRRKGGSLGTYRGYFIAQGQLSSRTVAATYVGANLTFTSIFLILSGEAYRRGWIVIAMPVFWLVGTVVFLKAYPRMAEHIKAGRTLHQTLGTTFESKTLQKWAAVWTIIAFIGTVGLEFYGGILLVTWTGVPLLSSTLVALSLAFIVSAFTISGGMRGVGLADIFLDAATLFSTGVLVWGILHSTPPVTSHSVAGGIHYQSVDHVLFVISMAILFVPFQFCTLDSWQRLLAWNKRGEPPTRWLGGASILLAIMFVVPIAIGVFARQHLSVPTNIAPLKVVLTWMQLPAGILGLCLAGLAGAVLSTADELLNCCSLSLLADFWNIPLLGQHSKVQEQRLFATGKFYTAVFSIIAAGLALLTLWLGRKINDMAVAVFSAQIVFTWPLSAALFTPRVAPGLAGRAITAMWLGAAVAGVVVAVGWIINDDTTVAAAPIAAFVVSGLVFCPAWRRASRQAIFARKPR